MGGGEEAAWRRGGGGGWRRNPVGRVVSSFLLSILCLLFIYSLGTGYCQQYRDSQHKNIFSSVFMFFLTVMKTVWVNFRKKHLSKLSVLP